MGCHDYACVTAEVQEISSARHKYGHSAIVRFHFKHSLLSVQIDPLDQSKELRAPFSSEESPPIGHVLPP
eukprot:scaffold69_cov248-Pinguiococcus_pyrenoidosus.AAC.70